MRIDRFGLVVVAALCAAAGCGDDDTVVVILDAGHDGGADAGQAHDAGVVDAGAENDGGEEDGGVASESLGLRKIIIHAVEYKLTPSRIRVNPLEPFTIELINDGVTTHSIEFDLPKPEGKKRLKSDVAPGGEGRMKLIAPIKKGSYDFFCPIDNHRALGMEGTLVVR